MEKFEIQRPISQFKYAEESILLCEVFLRQVVKTQFQINQFGDVIILVLYKVFCHQAFSLAAPFHMIRVGLPNQSAPRKHNEEKKPTILCTPHELLNKCVSHV